MDDNKQQTIIAKGKTAHVIMELKNLERFAISNKNNVTIGISVDELSDLVSALEIAYMGGAREAMIVKKTNERKNDAFNIPKSWEIVLLEGRKTSEKDLWCSYASEVNMNFTCL